MDGAIVMSVYGLSSPSRQSHKQRLDLTFAQSAFVSQKETPLLLAIKKELNSNTVSYVFSFQS